MKKTIIVVLTVIALVACCSWVEQRHIKNFIGSDILGYGRCPNCDDSWWWKDFGYLKDGKGVLICKICLSKPNQLDEQKIATTLRKYNWSDEKISLVKEELKNFKKENKK